MYRIAHAGTMPTIAWGSLVLLLISLWLIPTDSVEAAAYRCIDENGRTSYSEKPCSVDQRVNKIISGIGGGIEYHCELPKRLAEDTAATMRAGKPSSNVFRQYGGIHTLSPTTISIINYVYQFKHNLTATTERIVSLTEQRCEVGSFGVTDCEVFPSALVSAAGGCHGSGANVASLAQQSNPVSYQTSSSSNSRSNRNSSTVIPTDTRRSNESSANCRARVRNQLEGIESQLNDTVSTTIRNQMRARQRSLRRAAERC